MNELESYNVDGLDDCMATQARLVLIEVPEKERDILNFQAGGWVWPWHFQLVTTQPFRNPDNGQAVARKRAEWP